MAVDISAGGLRLAVLFAACASVAAQSKGMQLLTYTYGAHPMQTCPAPPPAVCDGRGAGGIRGGGPPPHEAPAGLWQLSLRRVPD
jgi:hypothetical protein